MNETQELGLTPPPFRDIDDQFGKLLLDRISVPHVGSEQKAKESHWITPPPFVGCALASTTSPSAMTSRTAFLASARIAPLVGKSADRSMGVLFPGSICPGGRSWIRRRWFADNSQFGRRRRLNAGQRAMLVAIAHREPAKYDRGNKNSCETREFDCGGLPRALNPGPNLVEDILAGAHRPAPALERLAAGYNHCIGNRPARRST